MRALRILAFAATAVGATGLGAIGLGATGLGAQARAVTVRGVAWDSIAAAPLPGAFISLDGSRSTLADSAGRFAFANVAPGLHRFEMLHAVLDSMGLPGVALQATVTDGAERVTISLPSFGTLWRAACGERAVPSDSGFLYGTIRDARDGELVPGADVDLVWVELSLINIRKYTQRMLNAESAADERGEYAICGVPMDEGLRLQASDAESASAWIDLGLTKLRVLRRDLLVGPVDTAESTPRGSIAGVLTDAAGRPYEGATVVLDDAQPFRTGPEGRFLFMDVLPGTRQVEVMAIGARPQVLIADVYAGKQASVAAQLARITRLDVVRITASRTLMRSLEQLEDRRASGKGQFLDSTEVNWYPTLVAMLFGIPKVEVAQVGGRVTGVSLPGTMTRRCGATLFIDGYIVNSEEFANLLPSDIGVIEYYDKEQQTPGRFWRPGNPCGAIVVWTKLVMP